MLYSHRGQNRYSSRNDYPDGDDASGYYTPVYNSRAPPPSQQNPGSSRRRPNPPPQQDQSHHHVYHRHRDDRDSWATPSHSPDMAPQPARRQTSITTNNSSEYGVRPRSRHGRSNSTSRIRSKSRSPKRHATPLPTTLTIPQLSLSERETLARQRLQTTFEAYVFNTLPTHLLRTSDMTLVTRTEVWETFKPRIESLPDSHFAKLLLEQDEEARRLGLSVLDPEVLAPFVSPQCNNMGDPDLMPQKTDYVRAMISFAIFSHRWGNNEPLFHELPNRKLQTSRRAAPSGSGYQKLLKFCEKARLDYDCEYVWSDTCCINKESSSELEEAILSMGVWYSEANICIAHLANSSSLEDFVSEPWFTRGWTLQELLLARKIRFYGKDWSPICPTERQREERAGKDSREDQRVNDKDNESLITAITKVTGIPEADIRNFVPSPTRVAEKMRWASQRITSRVEDAAYALLGLFDITMPIAYGDGPRAFYKLMSTLAEQCTESDFFAWAGKPSQWSLVIPSSPQCYGPQASQAELVTPSSTLGDPAYELTKLGLRTRLVLIPAYCEPLEQTDAQTARFMLTPAIAIAQEPIQVYISLANIVQHGYGTGYPSLGPGPSRMYDYDHYDHDPRERDVQTPIGRGPTGYTSGPGPSRTYDYDHYDHDPRERDVQTPVGRGRDRLGERERDRDREREYALGVIDYDVRAGPPGYAALHAGRTHLCLVLERDRRGRGWVRAARPGAVSVRFRESELLPIESVCLLHRA